MPQEKTPSPCPFMIGDYVDRIGGSYRFPGQIKAVYEVNNLWKCDVSMAGFGMLHIFNADQLVKITRAEHDRIAQGINSVLEGRDLPPSNPAIDAGENFLFYQQAKHTEKFLREQGCSPQEIDAIINKKTNLEAAAVLEWLDAFDLKHMQCRLEYEVFKDKPTEEWGQKKHSSFELLHMMFEMMTSGVYETIRTALNERNALRAFFLPLYKYAHDQNFSDETLGAMSRSTMDRIALEGIIKEEPGEARKP